MRQIVRSFSANIRLAPGTQIFAQSKKLLNLTDHTAWHWGMNCSSIGAFRSRIRALWFSVHPDCIFAPEKVPIDLTKFSLPTFISEFVTRVCQSRALTDATFLRDPNINDNFNPTLIGPITLDNARKQAWRNIMRHSHRGNIVQCREGRFLCRFGDKPEWLRGHEFEVTETS